ncbi:MAG: FimV/HubP family polar landmark protein [Stagnimonas sp.]|nr:FimV/HubP family polar landmark protein [Stagnimonas sp.]
MRRTLARITLTAAATAGLVSATAVLALGLGEIDVSSNLNQRFAASIPLTEISAEDLETVTVSVAPNEAYERAGIERSEYLSTLDFQVKNDSGRARVVVTSSQIAREPVVDLLVQARWSGGKIVRDYTILLDPPEAVAARPASPPAVAAAPVAPPRVVAAPVIAPPPAAKPLAAKPNVPVGSEFYETPTETKPVKKPAVAPTKPTAPAFYDPSFDSATGTYGPVAPRETLWSIAAKVRPGAAVSMDQVLLALSEANPVAIQRGTTVNKGAVLRVPSAERMQAASAVEAKAKLAALRGAAPVTTKPAVKTPPVKAAATPKLTEAVAPQTPIIADTRAELPKPPSTPPAPATAPVESKPSATAATPAPTTAVATPAPAAEASPADAASTAPAAASAAPAAETAVAAPPSAPALAAEKSPLAQPLPEESSPGLLSEFGELLGVAVLLLLLVAVVFALSRRRQAAARAATPAPFKPNATASVVAPAAGAGAVGKLGDTTRLSDTQALRPSGITTAMPADSTQQMTQPLQKAVAAEAPHQSTMILDPAVMAALNDAGKPSAVPKAPETFDRTTQVYVDTSHIDLGDNDPLSEADFHLAYGLYDEAVLLLKTATVQYPQRTDLKVKLAETYFASGRPLEFQEIAEDLKEVLSPAEWSKLAIMGSQICPDVALFQNAEGDGGLDADFDLAFDEPAVPETPSKADGGMVDFMVSTLTPPTPPAITQTSPDALSLSLDSDSEDEKKDSTALPPAGLDDNASIDFMLGQSLTPLGAGLRVPGPNELSFNLGSPALNVEMPKVDITRGNFSTDSAPSFSGMSEQPTITPGGDMLSLSLQDLEVSITPRQSSAASVEDELNTKLDLARAYVEMGDNDMARSLLQEVQQQGGERHQQEAASLLQRLPK